MTPPVNDRLHRLGAPRIRRLVELCGELPHTHVGPELVLAVFDRETLLRNIPSGWPDTKSKVYDHDVGPGQLNRVYWNDALRHVGGCRPDEWQVDGKHRASEPGYSPPFDFSVRATRSILLSHLATAALHEVPWPTRLYVAVAGYNAGISGALRGWKDGDPDLYTAPPRRDYSADVIVVRKPQIAAFLARRGFVQSTEGGAVAEDTEGH